MLSCMISLHQRANIAALNSHGVTLCASQSTLFAPVCRSQTQTSAGSIYNRTGFNLLFSLFVLSTRESLVFVIISNLSIWRLDLISYPAPVASAPVAAPPRNAQPHWAKLRNNNEPSTFS